MITPSEAKARRDIRTSKTFLDAVAAIDKLLCQTHNTTWNGQAAWAFDGLVGLRDGGATGGAIVAAYREVGWYVSASDSVAGAILFAETQPRGVGIGEVVGTMRKGGEP